MLVYQRVTMTLLYEHDGIFVRWIVSFTDWTSSFPWRIQARPDLLIWNFRSTAPRGCDAHTAVVLGTLLLSHLRGGHWYHPWWTIKKKKYPAGFWIILQSQNSHKILAKLTLYPFMHHQWERTWMATASVLYDCQLKPSGSYETPKLGVCSS